MLRRYRKIQLIDEQGAERTLLLSKTAKFQIGARYRFYFKKGSRPAVGNDYLDAALSTTVSSDMRRWRTQTPVMKIWKAGSKHPMSKK